MVLDSPMVLDLQEVPSDGSELSGASGLSDGSGPSGDFFK